jgi:hypothetical protein
MNAPVGAAPSISAAIEPHTRKRMRFFMTKTLFGLCDRRYGGGYSC